MKEITVPAKVEFVETITDFINEELEAHDCSMKTQMQIDIAIDEVFANIAYYAYTPNEGDAVIQVDFDDNSNVLISFIDTGVEYNPLETVAPDVTLTAEERKIGGLGIFIVRKTMDDVIYRHEDNKNILTIVKSIAF